METKFDRMVPFQRKGSGYGQVVVVILATLLADFKGMQLVGHGVVYVLYFLRAVDRSDHTTTTKETVLCDVFLMAMMVGNSRTAGEKTGWRWI
jgi:hypothetical protein